MSCTLLLVVWFFLSSWAWNPFFRSLALGILKDQVTLERLCGPYTLPEGSKVPGYRVFRVSISGILILQVLGRYLMVGYLDPEGYWDYDRIWYMASILRFISSFRMS